MNSKVENILNDAKQLRDEMQVQLNLGSAELKDQCKGLDSAYDQLKTKIEQIAEVAGDSSEELRVAAELGIKGDSKEDRETALELAAEEIKESYAKIKKLL